MAILIQYRQDRLERWARALARAMPHEEIRVWPDHGDPLSVEAVVTSAPAPGSLKAFPNLRFIASTGAGVERLLDPRADLPAEVPIVRLVDERLTQSMAEYVLAAVLRYHREFHVYEAAQRAGRWHPQPRRDPPGRTVGILGLGVLGCAAAALLTTLGFRVLGWTRRPKEVAGVIGFHGAAGLAALLPQSEILVCLLPLTPETRGIIDRRLLKALPRGACIVNAARGGHVVEDDLVAALDEGRIAHATLDVFPTEPLPPGHRLWSHPRVTVTPHVASLTVPETAAATIADALSRARAGLPLLHLVDRSRGY